MSQCHIVPKVLNLGGSGCFCQIRTMSEPYSCRVIGTLVAVGLGFLIVGMVISLATYEEECGIHNGHQCRRDPDFCHGSRECFCPGDESGLYYGKCEHAERQWSGTADAVISIFILLFWGFIIASIVFCVCRCVHKKDHERVHNVYFIPAETFYQEGKLWVFVQILCSAVSDFANCLTISDNHFKNKGLL